MARASKKQADPGNPVELVPVMAVHRVTYGDGVTVEPNTPFLPTTTEEAGELFDLEAVRDLTEAEHALWEKINPATEAPAVDPIG